ncbi:MAG: L-threonylcarbamoyladenylate synthase [Gammaproteobacteria bacterium]
MQDKQIEQISIAVDLLKQGKIIAFPTDTVYGIGGDPLNEQAILSIFKLKSRAMNQALPVLLPDLEHIYPWIDLDYLNKHHLTSKLFNLLANFWPGALTVVLKKSKYISNLLTANQDTIALRVPNHPITLALLKAFNSGIIGTSANKSGDFSAIDSKQVQISFGDKLFVLDGGICKLGKESTIISFVDPKINILRQGAIDFKKLEYYI